MRGEQTQSQEHQHNCLQICSRNNNTSLLLYACEVIYLISKDVISPYVRGQGGILLNFNILSSLTHYCTRNECQPF